MSVTPAFMLDWCQKLLDVDGKRPQHTLSEYLEAIPKLDSLSDVASGTPVLVRGDVDAKPGAKIGEGDIRLRSMTETLSYGRERGWKQVIFGHRGRKPEETLAKVAARLGELMECDVPLLSDWLDESTLTVSDKTAEAIASSPPGSILALENTRRYDIERVLWKATGDDLPKLSEPLAKFAGEVAAKIATTYVNEALSAGSLDTSSTVVPAAMQRVALGAYVAKEFTGPMLRCLDTELVIFSGLKADKLDDLEAMIARGKVKMVFTAGSLAMALKKAAALLDGQPFSLGVAEDPGHSDKPYFIPEKRIEQAKRMVAEGREKGIEFVLPVDFILQDGSASETIGPGQQQLDIGPKTSELFEKKVGEFIASHQGQRAAAFHNGVFGKFEEEAFAGGTKRFVGQLKRLKEAGIEVFVGGGEGGAALEKYGQPDDVTHVFTAGGTVLNALGGEPVPYLVALSMAAANEKGG
ncbi:MAG: phosphoglycerate kinase [Planctomycetota bacterium]|nr:MAG: phosphoglycerate kinase [Planctomycetota bacterium]